MQLYLIRHTQVDVPIGTCYGQTDVALADTYSHESKKVINQIKDLHVDRIYSSPLMRCKTLAQTICPHQENIIYDDRLKEMNFGDWEEKNWNEIEQSPQGKHWFSDYIHHKTPNGESYVDLVLRIESFINELKLLPNKSKILIITHGGVIRAFHTIINQTDINKAFNLEVNYGEIFKLYLEN